MTVSEILGKFKATVGMRALESDYGAYADRYHERALEEGFDPDWPTFTDLWRNRNDSHDDMAELLAETLGVAHDEALAWIEDY